ncbi:HNH endonuclease family protein [Corynebacterium sp.]|uniref:HNH endonuclease family protein n=1 Tax=Corynebacterium sp. TaxID=1720 RepID=UPI0026DA86AC|nr:HNH endonuclease family protein [Corynebacterium sp.]MDO5076545.1 HNH endonuclease family protein [Corynebacterium sp.]
MRHFSFGLFLIALTIIAVVASFGSAPGPSIPLAQSLPQIRVVAQRASVLGYQRTQFGPGWAHHQDGCTTRDLALIDALAGAQGCPVTAGTGLDPYSGERIGVTSGADIELDHVYPLRAAWDMGAYQWSAAQRVAFANDPNNLIVASKTQNQAKSDALPSEWMPPDPHAKCWYARRVAQVAASWGLPLVTDDISTMRRACLFREVVPSQLRLRGKSPPPLSRKVPAHSGPTHAYPARSRGDPVFRARHGSHLNVSGPCP